jgi:hypothetical protein
MLLYVLLVCKQLVSVILCFSAVCVFDVLVLVCFRELFFLFWSQEFQESGRVLWWLWAQRVILFFRSPFPKSVLGRGLPVRRCTELSGLLDGCA